VRWLIGWLLGVVVFIILNRVFANSLALLIDVGAGRTRPTNNFAGFHACIPRIMPCFVLCGGEFDPLALLVAKGITEGGEDDEGGAEVAGVDEVFARPAYESDTVLQHNTFFIIHVVHADVVFPSDGHYKLSVGIRKMA
jgi:hypothetical protein